MTTASIPANAFTLFSELNTSSAHALLTAVNGKQLASVIFDDDDTHSNSGRSYQSMLLGANLIDGELLISELFPAPSIYDLSAMKNRFFWLKIKTENQYLFIKVIATEITSTDNVVKILKAFMSNNQRWQPRASFHTRTGPKIELQPKETSLQKGWLQNISRDGGLIELYGMNTKDMVRKHEKFTVAFQFSNEFTPKWRIKIVEASFLRQPCCHLRLRFKFENLNTMEKSQISEFVDGFSEQQSAA